MNLIKRFTDEGVVRAAQAETVDQAPILIGLGANLDSRVGTPLQTLQAALLRLEAEGVALRRRSSFWRSPPRPPSDQPWFVNAVVAVASERDPAALLALLHGIEAEFGRVRREPNAARPLDLDLLAYGQLRRRQAAPLLPHPRLAERDFVLLPMLEIAPDWRHPDCGLDLPALIAALPAGGAIERLCPPT